MLFEPFSVPRVRFLVIAGIFASGTVILLARLFNVQVSQGRDYTATLQNQTTINIRLSPARGAIVDRNGVPLAENRASFDIDLYLDELVRNYSREHRGKLPRMEVKVKEEAPADPGDGSAPAPVKKRLGRVDIVKIVRNSLEPVSRSLGFEIKIDEPALRRHYDQSPTVPFHYRSDINFPTLAQFSERNLGVPGIQVGVRPVRVYNYGALAAHLLGYVGDPEDSDRQASDGHMFDTVGRAGLEKVYDGQLQGQPGGRILRINYQGYIDGEEGYTPPTVGNSVCLTLDVNIQYIVEQILRRAGRASAVVMDPNTGDILAMASVPSFDPNSFIPRITSDKWKALNTDPTSPLLNRSVQPFAPGSTFKVLVAMAALRKGVVTPDTTIFSPASISIGGHIFHDDVTYDRGDIAMRDALRVSCDTYFYQLGIKTGIDMIDQEAALAGMGQPTELPLPEDSGLIPGPAWLKQRYPRERWTEAYTANVSIGQGAVEVTPLQMATFMCAVANGGTLYYPRLIQGVADLEGKPVISVPQGRVRNDLGVKPSDMKAIHEGLLGVVEGGTATSVQLPYVKVAGKTGTAQFKTRLNGSVVSDLRTWFYCFAPYDKPRYVVCAMVEGGVTGGSTVGPLVHDILDAIFQMEKTGKPPELTYLTPAVGNFNGTTDYVPPAMGTGAADVPTAAAVPGGADSGADAPQTPLSEGDAPATGSRSSRASSKK